ncbi:MAG: right-handed parallel beta-helix repeat-containing protein [Candidatus Sabulitectum sp.]|nr:right-handed parallel beta-helix repeat-containing protein [Candidatus Sabulitectum sp.]
MSKAMRLITVLILVSPIYAQTEISGPQSGTLGPGTYHVVGEISVASGTSLTIAPGTTFLHKGNFKWLISGEFEAMGTMADSICFLRQQPIASHRWGGLHFISGAPVAELGFCVVDNCLLPYSSIFFASINAYNGAMGFSLTNCKITNAEMGVYGGGVYAKNASVTIDGCLISDNYANNHSRGTGVYLDGCNDAEILNSEISRNEGYMGGS